MRPVASTVFRGNAVRTMARLMIADDDASVRARMEHLLREAGYEVAATCSVADLIEEAAERSAQVLIVGDAVDGVPVTRLVPVLKECAPGTPLIVVGEDPPAASLRKLRTEGIFYHLQPPVAAEDGDEVRQAVECALQKGRALRTPPTSGRPGHG